MCVGPLKRFCHWGPLTALGIIKLVSFMMIHISTMMLPPLYSLGGLLNMMIFLILSSLTVYSFLSAVFEGPGYLPLKWVPESAKDEAFLQYCSSCCGYKAPRSHHCRKCQRCVLKMDHHCPWINNCVGHANHAHFTMFLFFSVCACIQSTTIFSISLFRANNRYKYVDHEGYVQFSLLTLILCVLALSVSIGVVIAVGMLFYFQMKTILTNRTGIEEWIMEKAMARREPTDPPFVYPYHLGWKKNLVQVLNFGAGPLGDGLTWPIVEGCNQYTLTIEQKKQKAEKRARTRTYTVIRKFSGYWFPVVHGCGVLFHPPITDESRIALTPGDTVRVTRWRQHWLFGEKSCGLEEPEKIMRRTRSWSLRHWLFGDKPNDSDEFHKNAERTRGWFPRNCVVKLTEPDQLLEDKKQK